MTEDLEPLRTESEPQGDETQLEMLLEETDPQEDGPLPDLDLDLDKDALCGAIETVIFMSDRPVPLTRIKGLINQEIALSVFFDCLRLLQEEYERPHHGIRLLEVAEGYQFRTKPFFAKLIKGMFKGPTYTLGPVAMEVLAIIAYKQPVGRNEIDRMRGVDSSHILRVLMDKKLVKVVGRSEDMGRPTLYGTTQEFLEVFGLKNLQDLPPEFEIEAMAQNSSVGEVSDIKDLIKESVGASLPFDELSELDELSKNIKSIHTDTLFTKNLRVEEGKGPTEERKSAFDVMEICLDEKEVIRQNSEALLSLSVEEILAGLFGPPPQELKEEEEEEEEEQKREAAAGDEEWEEVLLEDLSPDFVEEVEFMEETETRGPERKGPYNPPSI